jgi:hypothetical protein
VPDERPAEHRIARSIGDADIVQKLAAIPGADFTSLLLAVMRERADEVRPANVLRRYEEGRLFQPSTVTRAWLPRTSP